MDLMDLRRGLMAQMANLWRYEKHVVLFEAYETFDTYTKFAQKYVSPYVGDAGQYIVIINFYNNTSNTRACKYHFEYYNQSALIVEAGERVGGRFAGQYGGDVYAGATMELYICKDVPALTT